MSGGTTMVRSEREKMVAGEPYDAFDAELVAARRHAAALCRAINASPDAEGEGTRALVRQLLAHAGEGVWVRPPFHCDYGFNIRLGAHAQLNFGCVVLDVCPVAIGEHTLLGPAVQIYTALHPLDAQARRRTEYGKPVAIGEDVWVGGGAIVCPGVTIGARAVIGAGSVVTRDIPAGVLAAGNPCKVLRALEG